MREDDMVIDGIEFVVPDGLDVCLCGHWIEVHKHYSASTHCALCPRGGCDEYRGPRSLAARWLRVKAWYTGVVERRRTA